MKILSGCLLSLCVAGALAGSILLPLANQAVGKQAVHASDATNQFRNVANVAHKSQQNVAGNKDYGRTNSVKDDKANKATSALQAAASAYAQKSANADKSNIDQATNAHKASSASYNQHAAKNNAAAKTDHSDNTWTANRNYNNGNNRNDNINYAYDKKFDLNDNQDGAFVFSDANSANSNDNFYDRNFGYDRNIDQFAADASNADQQSNARSSSAKQNSAANKADRDNFGRDAANNNQLRANQRATSNKQDSAKQANRDTSLLDKKASGLNQANYLKSGNFKQQGAADKVGYGTGYQAGNLSPYYHGDNLLGQGAGSYGPSLLHPGSGGQGYGKNAGHGVFNYGNAQDIASNNQLQNTGAWGVQDNSRDTFSNDIWANDQYQGVDDIKAAAYRDHGFANKDNQAVQSANQAVNDKAQASAAEKQNQAKSNLDEDVTLSEVARKAIRDRKSSSNIHKRYYDNDNNNGNNWERLTYDRNLGDNVNGFDNQIRRDKAFKNVAQADNLVQSNNGKEADAASANQAIKDNQYQDWQRANNGFQNAQASSDNKDAAARHNFDNSEWKYEKDQTRGDNIYQNQANRDQGANFFNGNGAAHQGGAFFGGYPSGGGGGFNFGGPQSSGFYY